MGRTCAKQAAAPAQGQRGNRHTPATAALSRPSAEVSPSHTAPSQPASGIFKTFSHHSRYKNKCESQHSWLSAVAHPPSTHLAANIASSSSSLLARVFACSPGGRSSTSTSLAAVPLRCRPKADIKRKPCQNHTCSSEITTRLPHRGRPEPGAFAISCGGNAVGKSDS